MLCQSSSPLDPKPAETNPSLSPSWPSTLSIFCLVSHPSSLHPSLFALYLSSLPSSPPLISNPPHLWLVSRKKNILCSFAISPPHPLFHFVLIHMLFQILPAALPLNDTVFFKSFFFQPPLFYSLFCHYSLYHVFVGCVSLLCWTGIFWVASIMNMVKMCLPKSHTICGSVSWF